MKSFSLDTPSFATFSAISAALHEKVVTENLGHGIGGHDPVKGNSRGFPDGLRARRYAFSFIFSACRVPRGGAGAPSHDAAGTRAVRSAARADGRRSRPSSRSVSGLSPTTAAR